MLSVEELEILRNIVKVKAKGKIVFESLNNTSTFGTNAEKGVDCIGNINGLCAPKGKKTSCNG